ncbi:major facilitator superfamily domain-containing protein [Cantharellus anzutake]|uniref:major facilitator superfamily domain-containing protein n=1 Tax=Cantharellus anzutake TaxID=1750568 RepID=UPI0019053CA0|nr:major facilitator superfamily domain-containing protein [Cantharellus anzutake]KAF8329530.1 major facilitator superfamily domain-containing protein [Cantharellus anzutake]
MASLIIGRTRKLHDEELASFQDIPLTATNSISSDDGDIDDKALVKPPPPPPSEKTIPVDPQPRVTTPLEVNSGDSFLVGWDGPNDPENPLNWSRPKRWYLTILSSILVWNATFASSSPSGIIPQMEKTLGFSTQEVGTLTISLFVAGYCVGPLSGVHYRKFGCALSNDTVSILVFRFLSGCFAASPLTLSGALIGDIWDPVTRGNALSLFVVGPFAGPALGPAIGGFIAMVFWTCTIFAGVLTILVIFTLDETYHPVILQRKAARRRMETGDERWMAPNDRKITFGERAKNILAKPWKVLFREPMLLAITLDMSFVYGCLYLFFEEYPVVFGREGHGFNAGISGLMFLPLFVGCLLAVLQYVFWVNPRYAVRREVCAPKPVPPEERLPMAVVGGVLFTVGFFWFGWTSYPSFSYWSPMLAGGLFGISITLIFLSLFNYIFDTYLAVSASALAANTVCRSLFGASFPLFARQMLEKLHPRWTSTLLGCISLLFVPVPVLFIKYGPVLRAKSKYSPTVA